MRPIGGELELKQDNYNVYFTDSGRSSLKLFLRSDNQNCKYLIPDFICSVVEQILIEENIDYEFYHVNSDLSIDPKSVNDRAYDVLYVINYFGIKNRLDGINLKEKIILEDSVFDFEISDFSNHYKWFAFNSYRKFTHVSDGSMIKTNMPIQENLIIDKEANFVKIKCKAKDVKYNYLYNKMFDEKAYLTLFSGGEHEINKNNEICRISNSTLKHLVEYEQIACQRIRKKRFEVLYEFLGSICVNKTTRSYSFFVVRIQHRDEIQKKLVKNNIFLPVHWKKKDASNLLYDQLLSIPLFETYSNEEFYYLVENIKRIFSN